MVLETMAVGFLIGLRHALEPDHLAAVSTQSSQEKKLSQALKHGLAWGLGHTTILFLLGSILLFIGFIVPARIESFLELLIGIMLIYLGIISFKHKKDASTKRTFMIGSMHGLAGSSALVLIITASLSSITQRLGYILIFGIGSIIGMIAVGGVLRLLRGKNNHWLQYSAAVISIVVGVIIILKNGVSLSSL